MDQINGHGFSTEGGADKGQIDRRDIGARRALR